MTMLVVAGSAIAAPFVPWFTAPHVIGLAIAVLAAGLLVGSFAGGGRGLIWLLLPLSLTGFAVTAVDFDGPATVSSVSYTPKTVEEVQDRYEIGVGSVMLDLRQMPSSGEVKTAVESDLGELIVHVPPNADITFTCNATSIGELNCLGRQAEGGDVQVDGEDLGADGEGGLKIDLDVLTNVGEVKVLRD
ncbi:hypothetical protein [Lentzea guizhouensis]|uniref:hypothetical protein n=1 Tax=Lentzea guizhouensis TaxID=1586287 RepID=UPI001F43C7D5|nr:hypothetical protein [Lentzea guizhouensis]